jgi:hypothetical protein
VTKFLNMERHAATNRAFAEAAIKLVAAWDAGTPDTAERERLVALARARTRPHRSHECSSIEQGRHASHATGGGHYIDPEVAASLVEHLRMGLSHRAISAQIGINRKTVQRYEKLNGPFVCPCGRQRTHRGWCSERIKRSPVRAAFLKQWFEQSVAAGTRARGAQRPKIIIDLGIVKSNWPYLSGAPTDGGGLIDAVNEIVPRYFPDFKRADICQDLLLAILEGTATIETLRDGSADAIKKYNKLYPSKFGPMSLDVSLTSDPDGPTLMDRL